VVVWWQCRVDLSLFAFGGFVAALGFAILKYRLYADNDMRDRTLNLAVLSTSQNQLADRRLDRIFLRRRMFMPRGLLAAPR
jgi:hypothetical protein